VAKRDFIVTGGFNNGTDDSAQKSLRLWTTANWAAARTFAVANDDVTDITAVQFSPTGTQIVSGDLRGVVRVWQIRTGQQVWRLESNAGRTYSVAFSPDGHSIASAHEDGRVRVWNLTDGKLLHTLEAHDAAVSSVAFSPDSARISTCGKDALVNVWDTASGELIGTLFVVDNQGAAFTPDGYFTSDGDPRRAFKILRGKKELPLDDFIALNRRESLDLNRPRESAGK
jgi:WD40 repeat protein